MSDPLFRHLDAEIRRPVSPEATLRMVRQALPELGETLGEAEPMSEHLDHAMVYIASAFDELAKELDARGVTVTEQDPAPAGEEG